MAKYVQKHKSTGYHVDARALAEKDAKTQAKNHRPQTTTTETEELLDDIDELLAETLERNETAESFVAGYRQKGGQ